MTDVEINIRTYRLTDDDRIIEITKRAWPEVTIWKRIEDQYGPRGGRPWWYYKITPLLNFARNNPAQFFVAERERKAVGYAMYALDPQTKIGTVLDNAVDPDCRGFGIGSLLHRRVLRSLQEAGMEIARVETGVHQTAAQRLYEKHGFREVFREIIYLRDLSEPIEPST